MEIDVSNDSSFLVSASLDETLRIWDGEVTKYILRGHKDAV